MKIDVGGWWIKILPKAMNTIPEGCKHADAHGGLIANTTVVAARIETPGRSIFISMLPRW
jgi:hypothetical protein